MEENIKIALNSISDATKTIQSMTIGLFKPNFYPAGEYICVIEDNDGVLTCIEIGRLLGVQTLHIGVTQGHYVSIKETNRTNSGFITLTDIMKSPLAFDKWFRENCNR